MTVTAISEFSILQLSTDDGLICIRVISFGFAMKFTSFYFRVIQVMRVNGVTKEKKVEKEKRYVMS